MAAAPSHKVCGSASAKKGYSWVFDQHCAVHRGSIAHYQPSNSSFYTFSYPLLSSLLPVNPRGNLSYPAAWHCLLHQYISSASPVPTPLQPPIFLKNYCISYCFQWQKEALVICFLESMKCIGEAIRKSIQRLIIIMTLNIHHDFEEK